MTLPATPADLEDTIRREALKRYLEGGEEQSLDLLAVARAMAPRESAEKSKTSDSRASLRGSITSVGKSDTK